MGKLMTLLIAVLIAFLATTAVLALAQSPLDVTDGKIEKKSGRFHVSAEEMRAVLRDDMPANSKVELSFTYLGSSKKVARLGNGDIRHQLGLKLFAQDPCNLLYVMWDFDRPAALRVSVKSNPGMCTWSQCRDGGYFGLKPTLVKPLPPIKANESHVLTVETAGADFTVSVDGELVWQGRNDILPSLKGPAGVRSDNVEVLFDLSVSERK